MNITKTLQHWLKQCELAEERGDVITDPELSRQLRDMVRGLEREDAVSDAAMDEASDAFYRELHFGTGGLRGILGAGTNRMNVYTVARATAGVASYVLEEKAGKPAAAIGYDTRKNSFLFAQTAACVLASHGIQVYLYPEAMPTPCLSYAVRTLGCAVGIMITASHNPAEYNGYKVYGEDGCQITQGAAEKILARMEKVDYFDPVAKRGFGEALESGHIQWIPEEVLTSFLAKVKEQSPERAVGGLFGEEKGSRCSLPLVYTPLHGTGYQPIVRLLAECGYEAVSVVEDQTVADGIFATCPSPNPEQPEAFRLAVAEAQKKKAEVILATDPDCDRVAAAVRTSEGHYRILTGNETGLLLFSYLCKRRKELSAFPRQPVALKTIVTGELAKEVAGEFGITFVEVLTGFKYIGEQIGILEEAGRAEDFFFGFEDSCGYLSGTYVRDKDGVLGTFLICEMAAYYNAQGSDLLTELEKLYARYGYCLDQLHSVTMPGKDGMERMNQCMETFRALGEKLEVEGDKACRFEDFSKGLNDLPKAEVLKWTFASGTTAVLRPSGTEPKMKLYLSVREENRQEAARKEAALWAYFKNVF